MVIRKPYAFLIKHFKIIHLLLTAVLIYIAYKINNILTFFNSYISNHVTELGPIDYINYFLVFLIVLSIVTFIVIYILMSHKEKPKFVYLVSILGYSVLIVLLVMTFSYLKIIELDQISQKTIRLYRDFLKIGMYYQYVIIIIMAIRGLGFDLKKFNFTKDFQELNIEETDNEEIEVNVGLDTNRINRSINRSKREFKYYFIENKAFILVIIGIVVVIIGASIFKNRMFDNKKYKENEIVKFNSFSLEITDSFILDSSYKKVKIGQYDERFVVVRFNINNTGIKESLNLTSLNLLVGDELYVPDTNECSAFTDIGYCYKTQDIDSTNNSYIVIYKIDKKFENKQMTFIFKKNSDSGYSKLIFNLSPKNEDDYIETSSLKKDLNFNKTFLGNSKIRINSYEFSNKYNYVYKNCLSDNTCYDINSIISSSVGNILKLELSSVYDVNNIELNNSKLFEYYGTLKYIYNDKGVESAYFNNKTPSTGKDVVYIEVDKEIEKANKIWLELNIRGMKYKYILKES